MRILLLTICLFFTISISASTALDAEEAYRNEDWTKAELLYSKLLKGYPSNKIYNHRYGVTLYEQNKELALAEKCLQKAKNQGVILAYYYLGGVCFGQYKFDEAISYYKTFLSRSNTNDLKKIILEEHLPKCEQGKELIARTEDIKLLDKTIIPYKDFFLNFKVNKEAGIFLKDANEIDEDSTNQNSYIYITERGDRAFFAANNEGNSDLYSKNKLLDQWAEKTSLGATVNSDKDEAFPFLMSDGIALYFSSKGHNSFGDYDIFVTRYNASNNSYLPPQQLSMPFNSPSNDIMLAIDEYNGIGWFASDRDCGKDSIAIYSFVPNNYVRLLSTEDENARIIAAKAIMTASDSNKNISADNTSTIESQNIAITQKKLSKDIHFVVNDTLIYSSVSDFMSKEAKEKYAIYESTTLKHDSISQSISELRKIYRNTTDPNEKLAMIENIINLESSMYALEEQKEKELFACRKAELKTINENGGYTKRAKNTLTSARDEKQKIKTATTEIEDTVINLNENDITKPSFHNTTLYAYYEQIYSPLAVKKLIEANKMKTAASNKQYLADYITKEYHKPDSINTFSEKMEEIDNSFTPELTHAEIIEKISDINYESIYGFIKSNELIYGTLDWENKLLLANLKDEKYFQEIINLTERADFEFKKANQKLYISEDKYSRDKQKLSAGNQNVIDAIIYQEAASLTYLKYRYEAQKQLQATKPQTMQSVEKKAAPTVETKERIEKKDLTKEILVDEEYRIQVGIFSRILTEADLKLKDISYVQLEGRQLYKYFTGQYKTQAEAAIELDKIKTSTHKDAFIVKFINGKITK